MYMIHMHNTSNIYYNKLQYMHFYEMAIYKYDNVTDNDYDCCDTRQ